ncbi:unnamed protein product [Acanthoscelides obtectus]|uniref:Uncharacterized protein n=1 Tax=Acanthoscelides obtectus TaxID=200917 RepID=A0A9P0LYK5_ACAOB|nr:unnamed protein product [Acanthoscelides obtectus]CAK1680514.1 hypothetical protein AOBTE_LOCUS32716 [Acanthoscelides obtectus]
MNPMNFQPDFQTIFEGQGHGHVAYFSSSKYCLKCFLRKCDANKIFDLMTLY